MSVVINESGMAFGAFAIEDIFCIEQSQAVAALGDGIKKVEFIFSQDNQRLILLEAKTSFPREAEALACFWQEIKQKMLHSLTVFVAAGVGRHSPVKSELSPKLKALATLRRRVEFVLVVPNMPKEHCLIASDQFRRLMSVERRLWNIRDIDIKVINQAIATANGWINTSLAVSE